MSCGHPYSARWLSPGGWVEVCGVCSETRLTTDARYWKPARRELRFEDGGMAMYRPDGVLMRRD